MTAIRGQTVLEHPGLSSTASFGSCFASISYLIAKTGEKAYAREAQDYFISCITELKLASMKSS